MSSCSLKSNCVARRMAAIAMAVTLLSGCGSVSSTLGAVSGAADLVRIGALFELTGAANTLDVERMADAADVLIIAGEVSDVAGEGAEAAGAVEPLIEYLSEE